MPGRLYTKLRDHAVEQFGYITTRDAVELGVDPQRLQKMKDRGALTRASRGVFRFRDVPASALDQYAAATLWPLEVRGVLSHATALDLHDLSDINPSRIDVTVPRSFRTTRRPPEPLSLHRENLAEADITWHEGLPIVTPYKAIEGSIDLRVGWNLIQQAIVTARSRGRLTQEQAAELSRRRPAAHRSERL